MKANKKLTEKKLTKKELEAAKKERLSAADKIRKMESADIESKINDLKQELFNLRFQAAVGKLENTAQLNKVKKEIARMYTILTERSKVNG
jgi:large subunit ribosomal protein L29